MSSALFFVHTSLAPSPFEIRFAACADGSAFKIFYAPRVMKNGVNCYDIDGTTIEKQLELPDVFSIPIRKEIVELAFKCLSMNKRQPYAVSDKAGMQHSAHSWGTGRALARVPRVSGGGSGRSGQGAFANFCRKGRLAHPTNVRRRWQRKFNLTTKRHATAMAVAATAVVPLVESRGHRINGLNMLPLVVSNKVSEITNTKDAQSTLRAFGLEEELKKVRDSKTTRPGKGKMRNRRYIRKKGILIVYTAESDLSKAFRNIDGVDLVSIDKMSVLELCPGGHLGRLVMWTVDAFERLNVMYGKINEESQLKKGYFLPTSIVSNDDVEALFYSENIQAFLDKSPAAANGNNVARAPKAIEAMNPYLGLMGKSE